MFELIRRDLQRYHRLEGEGGRWRALELLRIMTDAPGVHAILIYRFGSWVHRNVRFPPLRYPLKLIHILLDRLCIILWGIHIDVGAEIGPGLYIGHCGGVWVGPVRMGRDCNLAHQVTLGRRADGTPGVPTLGDRVWIGTGSVLFGGIRIGNGVTIGPLTAVARSLPDRVLVIGNPMRVLRRDYDNTAEIYGTGGVPVAALAEPEGAGARRKRVFAADALNRLQAPAIVRRVRHWWRDEIVILAYHRILDLSKDPGFDFDADLVSASVDDFEWQMRYVRQHYTPVSFADLAAAFENRAPLPPRPLLVTFDDGFDDNYHFAFPVLRRNGVPATFFVSTGYVGQSHTFWFDWFFLLCRHAARDGVPVRINGSEQVLAPTVSDREIRDAIARLWKVPDVERRRAIARLEEALNPPVPADGFARSRPLTWEQVAEMAGGGMEFGSHTVSHPILTQLDDRQLRHELAESKITLDRHLRRPTIAVAYPVGQRFAYSARVQQVAQESGYRIGVTYVKGTNLRQNLQRYGLKRLHVEREVGRSEFAVMLSLPEIFA